MQKNKAKPFRILMAGHTYVAAINLAKLDAIQAFEELCLALLVPRRWKSSERPESFHLENSAENVRVYASPVLFSGRTGAYLYSPWTLTQAFCNFKPDIIHLHQEVFSLSAFQLAMWAMLFRKPLVIECAEDTDLPLSVLRRLFRRIVLDTARLIITCSHRAIETLRLWGFSGPIEVIPHLGVDPNLFSFDLRRRANQEFTVGYLGRFVQQKGVDLVFHACHRLLERGYNFRIMLCGAGPEQSTLREMANRLGIAGLVTWKGTVPHNAVPTTISAFDVLILPSRSIATWNEQFGHVLIEAMSMGIPVIGSTSGEIPYVIGRRDLLFPEGDSDALAVILERMISDTVWRDEISLYGVSRVQKHFTHQQVAKRLAFAWGSVIANDIS